MTDAQSHPSLDMLADLAGDVGAGAHAQAARTHLATCPTCTGTFGELVALPALLAATPAPPMPIEVVARIDAAIVRAAQDRAADRPAAVPANLADRRHRRARVARWLLGAATTAAAAVAIGMVVVNGLPTTSGSDGSAANAPALESSGGREPAATGSGESTTAVTPESTRTASSTLDDQVLALVARAETSSATKSTGTDNAPGTEPTPPGIDRCVASVNATSASIRRTPIAADTISYRGQPAVLLVFLPVRADSDPKALDVYVMTTTCLSSAELTLAGRTLLHTTVFR